MKLNVSGIETIEITDPKGLCNQPVPQGGQPVIPAMPSNPPPWQPAGAPWPTPATIPAPQIWPHTPYGDPPLKHTIWSKTMPRAVTSKYESKEDSNEKWGLGLPQTQAPEPQKWEKNWQGKMSQSPEAQNEVEG